MLLNLGEYHRPESLAEAVRLLRAGAGRTAVLAGGTELLGRHECETTAVIDLRGLSLAGVTATATGIAIGAMTTLKRLALAPAVQALAGGILARAAELSAPATIRAAATLGGTLAGSLGGDDLPTVLLALGARVALAAPELVEVPLAAFLRDREGLLDGAIISSVIIPAPGDAARGGFARARRTPSDRSILCAAVVVRANAEPAIAVGGVAPHARLLLSPTEDFTDWEAVSDHRGSPDYRRWVAPILVRRALAEAMGGAEA